MSKMSRATLCSLCVWVGEQMEVSGDGYTGQEAGGQGSGGRARAMLRLARRENWLNEGWLLLRRDNERRRLRVPLLVILFTPGTGRHPRFSTRGL
ncbi:hypothetical protein T492DRAFT_910705 [Pavlovales sp. CCMP2436]|nr:hypothetical protein T492DRAFT_910705 [Pavlovales sp. CCMP2436]